MQRIWAQRNVGQAQAILACPLYITPKHTVTQKNKHVTASVHGQLWVSTWFRIKSNIYVQIVTETVLESLLPFTIWYPHLPAALHITTTDPQPVSKRLHSPLLSNPTSLFHLGPMRTPRRRTAATISAHVNMQHLHTHHCESPLKITQLLQMHMLRQELFKISLSTSNG